VPFACVCDELLAPVCACEGTRTGMDAEGAGSTALFAAAAAAAAWL
jgi:hypothetical protein